MYAKTYYMANWLVNKKETILFCTLFCVNHNRCFLPEYFAARHIFVVFYELKKRDIVQMEISRFCVINKNNKI